MTAQPRVLSFDIFGTVVDWRRGLLSALARQGADVDESTFDRIVDAQGAEEGRAYLSYREITARSLEAVVGLPRAAAEEIAAGLGHWPLFPDSAAALRRLLGKAACVATTNSDRVNREEVEAQLGVRLSAWVCAEELRLYKPDERFWRRTAERIGEQLSAAWWHVSAYTDYDLEAARRLGLTTVFVERPHARPGPADHRVRDLLALADLVDRAAG
ncbi:MAG TPA: HAD-IA family hydrolase [Thermoanaerobaculia bacterium]|nr:HAD-IA family hydrolase [Thermoanaerobaculia bacterium]